MLSGIYNQMGVAYNPSIERCHMTEGVAFSPFFTETEV